MLTALCIAFSASVFWLARCAFISWLSDAGSGMIVTISSMISVTMRRVRWPVGVFRCLLLDMKSAVALRRREVNNKVAGKMPAPRRESRTKSTNNNVRISMRVTVRPGSDQDPVLALEYTNKRRPLNSLHPLLLWCRLWRNSRCRYVAISEMSGRLRYCLR